MSQEPSKPETNYNSISEDFEDSQKKIPKDPMKIELDDNGDNNPQLNTGINLINKLIPSDNDTPLKAQINPKKDKNEFISKKRKKKKKSDETKGNKKENKTNSDNSFKEGMKPVLLSVKTIIEIKGNITLANFDCNYFLGGIKQNKILYRSIMYQIIGYKYRKILMKAKPANSEDEKIFNYFLINTFEDLFKEYYKNNRKFLIGGEYKTIGLFKIFEEVLNHKKKEGEKNIVGFIDASEKIYNNFKGCRERQNKIRLKNFDKVKIQKFDNLKTIESLGGNTSNNGSTNIQKKEPIIPDNKENLINESNGINILNNRLCGGSDDLEFKLETNNWYNWLENPLSNSNSELISQIEESIPNLGNCLNKSSNYLGMELRTTSNQSFKNPINLFIREERDDNIYFFRNERFIDNFWEKEVNRLDYSFIPPSGGFYINNNFDKLFKLH